MTPQPNERRATRDAKSAHEEVEIAIALTPTGERRNLLTDANIHLLAALEKLKQAAEKANYPNE